MLGEHQLRENNDKNREGNRGIVHHVHHQDSDQQINDRSKSITDQHQQHHLTQVLPDAGGELVEREYQLERGRQSCCCSPQRCCSAFAGNEAKNTIFMKMVK